MKVSGKPQVPKILRSPLCAQKSLFLVKIEGGFDENKLEKSRIEKTPVFKKIGYSKLGLRKPNLRRKLFILKMLTRPKPVKRGTL